MAASAAWRASRFFSACRALPATHSSTACQVGWHNQVQPYAGHARAARRCCVARKRAAHSSLISSPRTSGNVPVISSSTSSSRGSSTGNCVAAGSVAGVGSGGGCICVLGCAPAATLPTPLPCGPPAVVGPRLSVMLPLLSSSVSSIIMESSHDNALRSSVTNSALPGGAASGTATAPPSAPAGSAWP